ncbi:WD40-repeat-containing domain protein [Powellomyces hirtus]|nr:WD40-repeat-containing domain protein [Powellomyces hirtus]
MLSQELDVDLAPNFSSDPGNFFQSDRDLELERTRNLKKQESTAKDAPGSPISLPSKVLAFTLVANTANEQHQYAYIAESAHVVRKVDLKSGKSMMVFRGHSGPVTSVAVVYDQDGKDVAIFSGSWDKTVRKWDAQTGALLATFTGHTDFIKRVLINGRTLYSASSDGTIRAWDTETAVCARVFKEHTRAVEDIVFSDDGIHLYSASSDTTIKKWDSRTGDVVATLKGHLTSVYALCVTEGSLWSASADKTAKRWDLDTNEVDSSFDHPDFVRSLAVFPGGAHLVTGSRDENVRVFDVASEKCVHSLGGHYGEVSDIKICGATIWTASLDGTIRQWPIAATDLNGSKPSADSQPQQQAQQEKAAPPPSAPTTTTLSSSSSRKKKAAVTMTEEEERELAELMGEDSD